MAPWGSNPFKGLSRSLILGCGLGYPWQPGEAGLPHLESISLQHSQRLGSLESTRVTGDAGESLPPPPRPKVYPTCCRLPRPLATHLRRTSGLRNRLDRSPAACGTTVASAVGRWNCKGLGLKAKNEQGEKAYRGLFQQLPKYVFDPGNRERLRKRFFLPGIYKYKREGQESLIRLARCIRA